MDKRVQARARAREFGPKLVVDAFQHGLVDDPAADHALVGADDDQAPRLVQPSHGLGRTRQKQELRRRLDRIRTIGVQHAVAIEEHQAHGLHESFQGTEHRIAHRRHG
jgi:hypothetical protein